MRGLSLGLVGLLLIAIPALAQEPWEGGTLISEMNESSTYLVDMDENIIKTWHGSDTPGHIAYMFSDSSIIRPCVDQDHQFPGNGGGGRIQKIDAEDNIVWDYLFSNYDYRQHHDIEPMPNGNVLMLAWERKTNAEAVAMGRTTALPGEMWPTMVAEIEPVGATGGNIVWEWHLWDHLIQDSDPGKPNYGVVSAHPERMDINYGAASGGDWIHANALHYDPIYDQIMLSSNSLREIWIIDHSTTTAEAAGHTGGNSGMGGDILYRWGNPIVYDRGTEADQYFHGVHGVVLIEPDYPGGGNILVMNNGNRPGNLEDYSSVIEITPPRDGYNFTLIPDEPYGPEVPIMVYEDPDWFYTARIGGAYRMPNGNTLICEGTEGYIFEVTEAGTVVWDYDAPAHVHRAPRYTFDTEDVPSSPFESVRLWPNHPNPFQPKTTIQFDLTSTGPVKLQVFDLDGSLVSTLIDAELTAGRHGAQWIGKDRAGRMVSSGVYLYRLTTPDLVQTGKMTLAR